MYYAKIHKERSLDNNHNLNESKMILGGIYFMNNFKNRIISRKLISLFLILVFTFSLVGCSTKNNSSNETNSTNESAASSDAVVDDWITVKVMKPKANTEVSLDQMAVFGVMSEKFHINFEFDNPPTDNFEERLNLVMMDDKLPDVIMDIAPINILNYVESGAIISLNAYINQMPNLKTAMDARPVVEKALTYEDGNIYYLPMLDEVTSGNMPYIVRADWLEKLNIESPVTISDWENYFKLVKETDLNGNGVNDEIPFSSSDLLSLRNFCTAWGTVDGFYTSPDDGGSVHYGPIDDKYKEAVTWMADMWSKKYIDQELITIDWSLFSAKVSQNLIGSYRGPLGGMLASFNASMPATIEGFRGQAAVPPVGPEGKYVHSSIDLTPRAIAAATITADCENVDRVVEWLDYLYSEEGALLLNMGIEGETYEMVNGEPIFTDYVLNNPDGLSPKQALGTFSFLGSYGPSILISDNVKQVDDESVLYAKENCIIPFIEESNKYILPSALSFSNDDTKVINAKMAEIKTYIDESILKFVTGEEPMTNWDAYVEQVNKMGIQEVLDIYQNAVTVWNQE